MTVGIIGSGNVGKALGKALDKKGERVLFYDISETQLEPLKTYDTTTDWDRFVDRAGVVAICVPTESAPDGSCDLSTIANVINHLHDTWESRWPHGIVLQISTCPPTTARKLQGTFRSGVEYVVVPSLYNMSRMEWDALHPVKILAGTIDGQPSMSVYRIFGKFNCPIYFATYETIELTKYAHNCLSATLISFWNELYLIAAKLSVDSDWVARTVATDPMFHSVYRFHGQAYGNACLPKDVRAFIEWVFSAYPSTSFIPVIQGVNQMNATMGNLRGVNKRPLMSPKKADEE